MNRQGQNMLARVGLGPSRRRRAHARAIAAGAAVALLAISAASASATAASARMAPSLPEIKAGPVNRVPGCVTSDRLMRFLADRNPKLSSRYADIAAHYQRHGEALGIRWDYAFFQMMLETANLRYGGDDRPKQNNFAGIGTTGGGVRGNAFPDISTGVLAQMQHLVAYAGDRVDQAVAPRTRDNQDAIIERSRRLARSVRFSDLQMRWAMDRRYAEKIQSIADAFGQSYCRGRQDNEPQETAQAPRLPVPVAVHEGRLATAGEGED